MKPTKEEVEKMTKTKLTDREYYWIMQGFEEAKRYDTTRAKGKECPLGGDATDCNSCVYSSDYLFNEKTGECEKRGKHTGCVKRRASKEETCTK